MSNSAGPAAASHPRHDALLAEWCDLVRRCRHEDAYGTGNGAANGAANGVGGGSRDDGGAPDPEPYGRDLLTRWSEPQRRYHTVDHLVAVLARAIELTGYADDPDAVALAAWFHDAVYRPDRSENEERSAGLAERALREAGLDEEKTNEVARLVRLTTTHDPADGDRNGEVLCDADLAVLAGGPADYADYAAAVRAEYGFVPDPDFRAGRADVLRQLLALPRLFRTPYGQDKWEATARRNVETELELLEA
jgi:predicted metal-dependent HD superfamily phosphohydrolase